MKMKISPEPIIHACPKCGSEAVMGIHKETVDTMTKKIIKEDKTLKLNCLKCGHKFWRKRMKFKAKKENMGGAPVSGVER